MLPGVPLDAELEGVEVEELGADEGDEGEAVVMVI